MPVVMMIFPSKPPHIPDPYTESEREYNIKERTVKCQWCKYWVRTSLPGPKCGKCHEYLINCVQHEKLG